MTSPIRIKICGLRTKADVSAAVAAGASYLGFNFFPKSPRFVEFDEARALAQGVQVGVAKVGLVVNVDNELLDQLTATVPLDMLQLHGAETPERVAEVRDRYGRNQTGQSLLLARRLIEVGVPIVQVNVGRVQT